MKIENNLNNEDTAGDIEFEFQDDSEEEDEDVDDVSKMHIVVIYIDTYTRFSRVKY